MRYVDIAQAVGISVSYVPIIAWKAGLPKRVRGRRKIHTTAPPRLYPSEDVFKAHVARVQDDAENCRTLGDDDRAAELETRVSDLLRLEELAKKFGLRPVPRDALNQQDTRE